MVCGGGGAGKYLALRTEEGVELLAVVAVGKEEDKAGECRLDVLGGQTGVEALDALSTEHLAEGCCKAGARCLARLDSDLDYINGVRARGSQAGAQRARDRL